MGLKTDFTFSSCKPPTKIINFCFYNCFQSQNIHVVLSMGDQNENVHASSLRPYLGGIHWEHKDVMFSNFKFLQFLHFL